MAGSWKAKEKHIDELEACLLEEEQMDGVKLRIRFPDPVPELTGTRKRASVLCLHNMLHIWYRESSTDKISKCTVLVSKHESSEKLDKFVSYLGQCS